MDADGVRGFLGRRGKLREVFDAMLEAGPGGLTAHSLASRVYGSVDPPLSADQCARVYLFWLRRHLAPHGWRVEGYKRGRSRELVYVLCAGELPAEALGFGPHDD